MWWSELNWRHHHLSSFGHAFASKTTADRPTDRTDDSNVNHFSCLLFENKFFFEFFILALLFNIIVTSRNPSLLYHNLFIPKNENLHMNDEI